MDVDKNLREQREQRRRAWSEDIRNRFAYHPPLTEERKQAHETVRRELINLALWTGDLLPEGRERSLVVTKLEEAMFWANAAIARQKD